MDAHVASLLLRQASALAGEGIGPIIDKPGDDELIAEALKVAGHTIEPAFMWWATKAPPKW